MRSRCPLLPPRACSIRPPALGPTGLSPQGLRRSTPSPLWSQSGLPQSRLHAVIAHASVRLPHGPWPYEDPAPPSHEWSADTPDLRRCAAGLCSTFFIVSAPAPSLLPSCNTTDRRSAQAMAQGGQESPSPPAWRARRRALAG